MITPYHSSVSPVSLHPWMIMAQESNPGKIQLCHSLTGIRVKNFPLSLNLTQFRVSKLTQGYNFKLSDNIHKIILCSSTSPSLIEVIVLYGKGTLVKLTARILESRAHEEEEEEEGCSWKKLKVRKSRQFWFHCLDDVVEYKKMVCAIDRNGKLYVLDTKAMYVERVLYRGNDGPDNRLFGDEDVEVGVYQMGQGNNFSLLSLVSPEFSRVIWPPPSWFSPKTKCNISEKITESGFFSQQASEDHAENHLTFRLSDDHAEKMVTDSSDESSSDDNKDQNKISSSSSEQTSEALLMTKRPCTNSAILPFDFGSETVFSSSVVLNHPPVPGCSPPWIVSSVENRGKTQLFHPFFGETLPNVPENVFLHQFHPCYLGVHYHMTAKVNDNNCSMSLFSHDKVLLFDLSEDQSFSCMVKKCSVLVLSRGGQLTGYKCGAKVPYFHLSYGPVDKFDDIICFKGVIYALDSLGKLYQISTNNFPVLQMLVNTPVVKANSAINGWRKRLVASPWDEQLYLVIRDDLKDVLKVYKFSKCDETWNWVRVQSFVDNDQVLFLSRVYSFFAPANEFRDYCQLSNCIFFYDAFPSCYNVTKQVSVQEEIQVFWLGRDSHNIKPISSYPGFPAFDFFTPPKWIWQDHTSLDQSNLLRETEEDEDIELVTRSGASSQEHISAFAFGLKSEEQTSEVPCTSAAKVSATLETVALQHTVKNNSDPPLAFEHKQHSLETSEMNNHKNGGRLGPDFSEEKDSGASSPVTPTVMQACRSCSSAVEFKGIVIKSEFLPTLQVIWDKHGSLFDEDTVRSKDIRACALESLAKLNITLQNTTGRTLTDSRVDEIRSIVSDLQRLGLRVDWLIPVVKKAATLQRSKPFIKSIMALDKEKAEIDKKEKEFLALSAKIKQELEDERAHLSAMIPFPEVIDLDDCLGSGM
ncbi:hypothetical protein BVRB_5g118780 [Beta vulgaris subsp. vulgaris]|nr:hypothetical protein BVRB_5g118780 [Beta vulgaris subsp. vulgaris]